MKKDVSTDIKFGCLVYKEVYYIRNGLNKILCLKFYLDWFLYNKWSCLIIVSIEMIKFGKRKYEEKKYEMIVLFKKCLKIKEIKRSKRMTGINREMEKISRKEIIEWMIDELE